MLHYITSPPLAWHHLLQRQACQSHRTRHRAWPATRRRSAANLAHEPELQTALLVLVREPNLRIGRFSIDRCTQRWTNRPSAHRFTMVS